MMKRIEEQLICRFTVVGLLLSAAATGVSVAASKSSADAQTKAANYNAAVENNNASAANQQAQFDAAQIEERTARNVGSQRAAMASSGFDANTGSFTDVQSDTQRKGELAKLSRIYQGQLGIMQSSEASGLDTMQGQSAQAAGNWAMAGTLIGGAANATRLGYQAEQNPGF